MQLRVYGIVPRSSRVIVFLRRGGGGGPGRGNAKHGWPTFALFLRVRTVLSYVYFLVSIGESNGTGIWGGGRQFILYTGQ